MRVLETRAVQRHCCLQAKTRGAVVLARQRRELSKKRYCACCRRTEPLDQCPLWVNRVVLAARLSFSGVVKVCGCRPDEDGAARTGGRRTQTFTDLGRRAAGREQEFRSGPFRLRACARY